jgi:hypothetical protein
VIPGEPLRARLYEAYASQHLRCGDGEAAALIYRHDILSALPQPIAGPVLDIGCRQGHLVKPMLADGTTRLELMPARNRWPWPGAAGLDRIRQGN